MRVLLLALLLGGCRGCDRGPSVPEPDEGKWFAQRYRTHRFDPSLSAEQREQMEMLEAIGYADGTQPFSGTTSVTVHDRDRAWQGYNFYNSGHGPEAVLVDMDGNELHRWHHEFWDAFPRYPVSRDHGGTHNFRRAWLRPDGHVYAIHEGLGMLRMDADSELVWANPGRMHHDADFAHDGTIWVLSREVRLVPRVDPDDPIVEDFLSVLDPDTGRERDRISILEAIEGSAHAHLLDRREDKADIFHTNTVQLLDGRAAHLDPAFAAGNVLISMRNLSAIAVIDPKQRKVVWSHTGSYRLQHDPSIGPDGQLTLFDNRGMGSSASRVIRYALPTMEPVWELRSSRTLPLDSGTLGAATVLPNGNVLVTESEQGRAFEYHPDGEEIVWEFYNPHTAGPEGEYVAALFELMRLPPDFPVDWAKGSPTPSRGPER